MFHLLKRHTRASKVALAALFALPCLLGGLAWRAASWRPAIAHVSSGAVLSVKWAPDQKSLIALTGASAKVLTSFKSPLQLQWLDPMTAQVQKKKDLLLPRHTELFELFSAENMLICRIEDTKHPERYPSNHWIALSDTNGKIMDKDDSFDLETLSLSSDSTRLMIGAPTLGQTPGGHEGLWKLYEIQKNKLGRILLEREEPLQVALWAEDGRLVWFALRGGEVGCVTRDGKPGRRFNLWKSDPDVRDERDATALVLSPDANTFALATSETTPKSFAHSVSIVDAKAGHILNSWHPMAPTTVLAFSPQGDQLAVADDKTVILHPMKHGTPRILPSIGATTVAFSPDGSHLAVGTSKGEVQVWRTR